MVVRPPSWTAPNHVTSHLLPTSALSMLLWKPLLGWLLEHFSRRGTRSLLRPSERLRPRDRSADNIAGRQHAAFRFLWCDGRWLLWFQSAGPDSEAPLLALLPRLWFLLLQYRSRAPGLHSDTVRLLLNLISSSCDQLRLHDNYFFFIRREKR